MEINVLKSTERNEAEILIVGLSRHPENAEGWEVLEERFDGRFDGRRRVACNNLARSAHYDPPLR